MLRNLKLEVFYPHPPERVWQAIANRRALAAWLMDNDFEPRLGHQFRFQPQHPDSLEETIFCEVLELDEPKSLSYSWRGCFSSQSTVVTWTLEPVEGGTQVKLEHKGWVSKVPQLSQPMRMAQPWQGNAPRATLESRLLQPTQPRMPFPGGYGELGNCDRVTLNFYLDGGWHTALKHGLQDWLSESVRSSDLVSVLPER
jgi:uncharacterized protein YndB with AHSA1/START domain